MAELILSLGILAVTLIAVSTLFISLYRSSEKSSRQTAGVVVAETVLNQLLHDIFLGLRPGLSKADFFNNNSPPAAPIEGNLVLSNTEYLYRFEYVTITTTSGTVLGAGLGGNRLKSVTVTCWWWGSNENSMRQGLGRLSVQLKRLVNENAKF